MDYLFAPHDCVRKKKRRMKKKGKNYDFKHFKSDRTYFGLGAFGNINDWLCDYSNDKYRIG
jgi:hypothetical protein